MPPPSENAHISRRVLDLRELDFDVAMNVPSLPAVALQVLDICQSPDSGIDELATVVSRDPALAAKVLQMANSPFYNRGHEVTSLQRAAMLLGRRAMTVLALGFSLSAELPRQGTAGGLELSQVWHRSLVNAVMGRSLALRGGSTLGEEVFLAGLLSHLGKIVLAQSAPERYQQAVDAGGGWPSEMTERAVLGFTSSEVAEAVLRQWGVPDLIVLGASYAERFDALPADASDEARRLVEITALTLLASSVFFEPDNHDRLARFSVEAERRLGLDDAGIDELVEKLQRGLDEIAAILSIELPSGCSYAAILDQARMQVVAISLDAVMDLASSEKRADELATLAQTDPLTGLPNRAALDEFLARQVELRLHGPRPEALGVLMIDIDHFKSVNDTYGHQLGDEVLRTVGSALAAITRESELMCRYGGEEFCLVLPQTSPIGLMRTAERLRVAVAAIEVPDGRGGTLRITASFGGACAAWVRTGGDGRALVELADRWLYRAKRNGRDRSEICPATELEQPAQ
jgi:diguanylate cyclase (GGDEF)-like protein